MDICESIKKRHSVRTYIDKSIDVELVKELKEQVDYCNSESGLNIQIVTDEPDAFSGIMAHYGKFRGVRNYIALIGNKKDINLDEKAGYYGEHLVLKAQQMGLNTCWVALTFSKGKSKCVVNKGEKLVCVIALGYGENQGVSHRNKPMEKLYECDGPTPEWFKKGMDMAILAPTAVNQQKFKISLLNNKVAAKSTGGAYSKLDLGIVKYHFEIGAGKENFRWDS